MDAYSTADWGTFFGAEAGASAALAGLVFVAASINLQKILDSQLLRERAVIPQQPASFEWLLIKSPHCRSLSLAHL